MPNPVEHQLRCQRENVIEFKVRCALSLSLPLTECVLLCLTALLTFLFLLFSFSLFPSLSLFLCHLLTQFPTATPRQISISFLLLLPLSLLSSCLLPTSILVCFPYALLTIFAQFMAQIITILWHCYGCYDISLSFMVLCLLHSPSFASICNYH